MNTNKINFFLPNTNKWQGITITKDAIKQILFLINLDPHGKGIRLSIKKSGCAGFRYTMTLERNKKLQKKEMTFFYQNILVYISHQDVPFFNGVKIDFIKKNINKVFTFYNSKLDKFCGCGESFSI